MADQQPEGHCDAAPHYPFRVDSWPSSESRRRRFYFLTHAHLDHTRGIASSFAPIFCTPLTARLVLLRHPQMHPSAFSFINIEEPKLIEDDREGSFTATAYDAYHCPGAVMFLFEGSFGTVLHTGDCRLTAECCARLPRRLFGGLVDCLFLDCTFGKEAVRMPTREEAIRQVKQCIWNHPDAPTVYLACDLLGQEMLLRSLYCAFGFKIYVDKHTLADFYGSLSEVAPDLLVDDPKATRFQVCEGFPRLYEKVKAKFSAAYAKNEPEPLFIRPSAQWYTYGERLEGVGSGLLLLEKIYEKGPSLTRRHLKSIPVEAERDPFGIWHVCYSIHSSRDELEMFVEKLKPRQVVSTIPHCKATELSYVKALRSSTVNARVVSNIQSLPFKSPEGEHKGTCIKKNDSKSELPFMEIPSPIVCLPLFGMAVAGLMPSPALSFNSPDNCSAVSLEDCVVAYSPQSSGRQSQPPEKLFSPQKVKVSRRLCGVDSPVRLSPASASKGDMRATEKGADVWRSSYGTPEGKVDCPQMSSKRKISGLCETTRRIYRSLNMVIPRPLPSLVELDREIRGRRF